MALDLSSLRKAVTSLGRALRVAGAKKRLASFSEAERQVIRAGVVQNFEFTYELAWKFMKRFLEADLGSAAVDGLPRKELFRIAAEHRLLDDAASWFDFHAARNRTTHTYDEKIADEVLQAARRFAKAARALLEELEDRNG